MKSILNALITQQGASLHDISKGEVPILLSCGAQGDGLLQISPEINKCIVRISSSLKAARPETARNINNTDWAAIVRESIGLALGSVRISEEVDAQASNILDLVNENIDKYLNNLSLKEYIFGTTLFSNGDIPSFEIGPVRIEPRDDWLNRKVRSGDISSVVARMVRRIWSKSGGRKSSRNTRNKMSAYSIFNVIGRCPYVCSIRIEGFGQTAGLQAAADAARLALTCIAMMWERSSETLDCFRLLYDGPTFAQHSLYFRNGKISGTNTRMIGIPSHIKINREEWDELFHDFANVVAATGDVINYFLDWQKNRNALINIEYLTSVAYLVSKRLQRAG